MKNLTAAFKPRNLKLTPQRIAVYKILKNTKAHPSAEMIYDALKVNYPTMSLATVYKTLNTLVNVGLIQELNVGESSFRYDANAEPHPHIICVNCNKVDDVEGADVSEINNMIKGHTDYEVLCSKVYYYGLCPNCRQKKGS